MARPTRDAVHLDMEDAAQELDGEHVYQPQKVSGLNEKDSYLWLATACNQVIICRSCRQAWIDIGGKDMINYWQQVIDSD